MIIKNLSDLKNFLSTLTEEQLQQPAVLSGDETPDIEIKSVNISTEDLYYNKFDNDDWGPLDILKQECESEFDINNYTLFFEKGTIQFSRFD